MRLASSQSSTDRRLGEGVGGSARRRIRAQFHPKEGCSRPSLEKPRHELWAVVSMSAHHLPAGRAAASSKGPPAAPKVLRAAELRSCIQPPWEGQIPMIPDRVHSYKTTFWWTFSSSLFSGGGAQPCGTLSKHSRRHFGGPDPHRGLLCRMVFYGMAEVASRTMKLSACCHRSNAEPISRECRWRLQMLQLCSPQCVRPAGITDGPRAHDSPTALRQSQRLQRSCSRC
jgi:hypothetical protein